jgi:hypothetical protein
MRGNEVVPCIPTRPSRRSRGRRGGGRPVSVACVTGTMRARRRSEDGLWREPPRSLHRVPLWLPPCRPPPRALRRPLYLHLSWFWVDSEAKRKTPRRQAGAGATTGRPGADRKADPPSLRLDAEAEIRRGFLLRERQAARQECASCGVATGPAKSAPPQRLKRKDRRVRCYRKRKTMRPRARS